MYLGETIAREIITEAGGEVIEYDVDPFDDEGTGAGFAIVRKTKGRPMILTLVTPEGDLDLPKGGIDEGESHIEAAIRETHEEAGVSDLFLRWGLDNIFIDENLVMFIATTDQEGVIRPNASTGEIEHDKIIWMELDKAHTKLPDFLRPVCRWASSKFIETDFFEER